MNNEYQRVAKGVMLCNRRSSAFFAR